MRYKNVISMQKDAQFNVQNIVHLSHIIRKNQFSN